GSSQTLQVQACNDLIQSRAQQFGVGRIRLLKILQRFGKLLLIHVANAQIIQAVGLSSGPVRRSFGNTLTRLPGLCKEKRNANDPDDNGDDELEQCLWWWFQGGSVQ